MNLYNKFMTMSARPTGLLGRIMIKFMNWAHTPTAKWHLSLIDFSDITTILDEGCGGGKNIQRMLRLCPKAHVYGIDYSEESVAATRKKNSRLLNDRCFIEQGNAMALDFGDNKFDLVTAFETVYFWPELQTAFSETFRVLKPGRLFVFSYGDKSNKVMSDWENTIEAMHLLPIDEVKNLLTQVGFINIVVQQKSLALHIDCQKPE